MQVFTVTVANVAPTLTVVDDQFVAEGSELFLKHLGVLTDPAEDNPLAPGGATVETFTYSIDWGDNMPLDSGAAVIPAPEFGDPMPVILSWAGNTNSDMIEPNVAIWKQHPMSSNASVYCDGCEFAFGVPEEAVFPGVDRISGSNAGPGTVPLGPYTYQIGKQIAVNDDILTIRSQVSGALYRMDILSWKDDGYPGGCYDADGGASCAAASGETSYLRPEQIAPTTPAFDSSHTYTEPGTYTVSVTDDDGGSDVETFEVNVYGIEVDNDGPVASNAPVTLTVNPTNMPGILTAEFDFDNDGSYEVSNGIGVAQHAYRRRCV